METVIRKRYTREFKAQAVGLVGMGKPVKEVARDLALSEGVLYEWVRKAGAPFASPESGGPPAAAGASSGAEELRRLRRENAHLKLENDILKKAAVILGTKPQSCAGR